MNPRHWIFYPILFAAYPVIFLYAHNLDYGIKVASVVTALGVVVASTAVLWLILSRLLRSVYRAALLSSIFVILTFSFGYVREVSAGAQGLFDARNLPFILWLLLITLWFTVILGLIVGVIRWDWEPTALTPVLTTVAVALLAVNVVPVANNGLSAAHAADAFHIDGPPIADTVPPENKRDIYYLIFDRYANEKTLSDDFHFNNDDVLSFLEHKGFVVAHESTANHLGTAHSLASSMNMTYLNHLLADAPAIRSGDYEPLYGIIEKSRVAEFLRSIGYQYYWVGSWWEPTNDSPIADVDYSLGSMSQFSRYLLEATFIPEIYETLTTKILDWRSLQVESFRNQLERIPKIARDPRPTFTFVHFLMPHPPYVFDRDGHVLSDQTVEARTWKTNYKEQLIYTNKEMKQLVGGLLAGPADEDPIIIIQSDEGPTSPAEESAGRGFSWFSATDRELQRKLRILNAYYFPGHDGRIYQTISPVNSFRLLFDEYLGTHLPLLPDKTYVQHSGEDLFTFKEVTDRLR